MEPGTLLAERYRVEAVLATGGMGVVYAATDLASGRPSAVKVLKRELVSEPRFVERLRREARAASSLAHPNIVEVTDLVIEEERAFLVMERLEGEPWGKAISSSASGMPMPAVAAIGRQLLSALDAAHHTGLIHRDIKPDNVFLASGGGGVSTEPRVKLLDFGLVKLEAADRLTASHSVLGTWQYMAPEQARGERTDGRADLYSVGACLYYALTKKRPYQAVDTEAATFALSEEPAPPLKKLLPAIDPGFAAVIERALAKDLTRRWQSAREMLEAISRWAPGTSLTARPRIEPESDDDIRTNPVRPSRGGSASSAVLLRPRLSAQVPAAPVDVSSKHELTSEDLVEVATTELAPVSEPATSRVPDAGDDHLDEDDTTSRQEQFEEPSDALPNRASLLEPESLMTPRRADPSASGEGARPVADSSPFRRAAPSRHRWRPPPKVRVMPLPPSSDIELESEPRRPPVWLLVLFSVLLFVSGLALGRLVLG